MKQAKQKPIKPIEGTFFIFAQNFTKLCRIWSHFSLHISKHSAIKWMYNFPYNHLILVTSPGVSSKWKMPHLCI